MLPGSAVACPCLGRGLPRPESGPAGSEGAARRAGIDWTHGGWLRLDATPAGVVGTKAAERRCGEPGRAACTPFNAIGTSTSSTWIAQAARNRSMSRFHGRCRTSPAGCSISAGGRGLPPACGPPWPQCFDVVSWDGCSPCSCCSWRRSCWQCWAGGLYAAWGGFGGGSPGLAEGGRPGPARDQWVGRLNSTTASSRFLPAPACSAWGQTPCEFAHAAGTRLATVSGRSELYTRAMQVVEAFYRVRFGRSELDPAAARTVERALEELTAGSEKVAGTHRVP